MNFVYIIQKPNFSHLTIEIKLHNELNTMVNLL